MIDNNSPFFCVMISTYNRPQLVLNAVKSVISQHYSHYFLTIFNDGSTENYSELEAFLNSLGGKESIPSSRLTITRYGKNIEYIKSTNIGLNESSNFVISKYQEEYQNKKNIFFTILNDDDYFTNNAFNIMTQEINKHANKDWFCFNCIPKLENNIALHNSDFLSYQEMSYKKFRKKGRGDKHHIIRLNTIGDIRYPPAHFFKNGYEHIFFLKIPSKIFVIPKAVKVIEYQPDGLSMSNLYDNIRSFKSIIKHIYLDPKQPLYYRWFFNKFLPHQIIKDFYKFLKNLNSKN